MLKEEMQQLLFDLTVGGRLIQSCHWGLLGIEFISIHPYLGELYSRINQYTDITAEQIQISGNLVESCLTAAANGSIIKVRTEDAAGSHTALNACLEALKVIKKQLDKVAVTAESELNVAANDVFSGLSSDIDKDIYFLSHSEGHKVVKQKEIIAKYYDDEQLIFGWASVAKDTSGQRPIDWQGDVIDAEDLEPAVYDFVLNYGESNDSHLPDTVNGKVVESVMFTKEKMQSMGIPAGIVPEGWWCGFKIDKREDYLKVKSGEYQAFSIEGSAVRSEYNGD